VVTLAVGIAVNATIFTVVNAAVLRTMPSDDRERGEPVIILGSRLWRARYAAGPSIVGKTIRVGGVWWWVCWRVRCRSVARCGSIR
jgi:hypothetical protein